MLESPAKPEVLDGLLRFRASVAHNINYADQGQMKSMASQICDGDEKLHLSGRVFSMHEDVKQFEEGAFPLAILTIGCWIMMVLVEQTATSQFVRAIWTVRTSERTSVVTDSDSLDVYNRVSQVWDQPQATLIRVGVVVRLTGITLHRKIMATLFIALPRFLLSLVLCMIGIKYLAITSRMEDLLLNGMALAFIAELDELMYALFTPRRAKTLIENLEPLPANRSPWSQVRLPWVTAVFKFLIVAVSTVLVAIFLLSPFFASLKQVVDILCSGDTNFVVAYSSATGMVHATKATNDDEWSSVDKSVLRLAQPVLKKVDGWEATSEALDFSGLAQAVVEPAAPSWSAASVNSQSFYFLTRMARMSVEDSSYLRCEDMVAGQNFNETLYGLQAVLGNSSIKSCVADRETIWPLCGFKNMTALRAICPITCGCARLLPQYAGFFAHPAGGCPVSCKARSSAMELYFMNTNKGRPCDDTRPPFFFFDQNITETIQDGGDIPKLWFTTWVKGMYEYLIAKPGWAESVRENVKLAGPL
jgi:hypothetical protein